MSTPLTSPQPDMPAPTSPIVPLRSWFAKIGDWIAGMSPSGATAYDSGWVDIVVSAGVTAQSAQVRRIGHIVLLRGQLSRTGGTPWGTGVTAIGEIPATIAPGWETSGSATTITGNDGSGIPRPLQAWIAGRTISIYQDTAVCTSAILAGLSPLSAS